MDKELMLKSSKRGTSDRYYIKDEYLMYYNESLDYAGVEYYDEEDWRVYDLYYARNVTEEINQYFLVNFWEMTDEEKLSFILDFAVNWHYIECDFWSIVGEREKPEWE